MCNNGCEDGMAAIYFQIAYSMHLHMQVNVNEWHSQQRVSQCFRKHRANVILHLGFSCGTSSEDTTYEWNGCSMSCLFFLSAILVSDCGRCFCCCCLSSLWSLERPCKCTALPPTQWIFTQTHADERWSRYAKAVPGKKISRINVCVCLC